MTDKIAKQNGLFIAPPLYLILNRMIVGLRTD
jgi:hypothetical protein